MAQEQSHSQADTASPDEIRYWQRQLLQGALRAMVVFGVFMVAGAVYSGYVRGNYWVIPIYLTVYLIVVIAALLPRVPYRVQVAIILLLLYTLTVVVFITRGLGDSSRIYLLTMLFVVGIFLDWKESIYALLFTLATMAVFGWLFSNGFITNYDDVVSTDPLSWSNLTFELLGMGVFIVVSLNYLVPQIREALTRSRMLTQELEQIQANLEKQVAERTRSAEQARLEAEKTRQSLEQQLEFVSAQAQLNDILRSEQEIDDLADNVLSYLCRYLDAPVGILYLLENGALRRAGQFALPVDFAQDVQIKPGEGLVGQSALEKRTIIMRGVSSESLKINSGLGQAPPATILIVPLIYSDEVVGVLELGLLDNDIAGKTMFLEKVDESVAIAFNAINDRLRIEHLLAETQRQAERLRSQEEELRTTNEELRAQADIRYSGRDA